MMKKALLKISGMHCVSCAMNIDGALEEVLGVASARTNYATAELVVEFDEAKVASSDLIAAVKNAGYDATPSA